MARQIKPFEKGTNILGAHAEKPPKKSLSQETVEKIRKLAMEGKSPIKIRALTGIGIMQVRRHTSDIDYGSANDSSEDLPNPINNEPEAQVEVPEKKVLPDTEPRRSANTPFFTKMPVPASKQGKVPLKYLLEAKALLKPYDPITQWPSVMIDRRGRIRQKKAMHSLTENVSGNRYVPPAKREILEHEQIMKEHDLPILKKVYFDLMEGKSPEAVSEEIKIPVKRIVQIIFNRLTQKRVFDKYNDEIQGKYAMPNEQLGLPKEPDIIARNKALLYVVASRMGINRNPKYWEKKERRRPLV